MHRNHSAHQQPSFARFALGQTYITPGAEKALMIAGQTEIEFLRRHMSNDWGEVSDEDARENEISMREGSRLLSAYRTVKGQNLGHLRSGSQFDNHSPAVRILTFTHIAGASIYDTRAAFSQRIPTSHLSL